MLQANQERAETLCLTMISGIRRDPKGFQTRLLAAGLLFAPGPVRIRLHTLEEGPAISAVGPACTGYLYGADGVEASETDLYRFLEGELRDGEAVLIFGKYAPEEGRTVKSTGYFMRVNGRIRSAEERTLIDADGRVEDLKRRSDIEFGNVVPLRGPTADPDPFV